MSVSSVLIAVNVRWWNAEAAYALNVARGLMKKGIKTWLLVNPGSPVHAKAEACRIPTVTNVLLDSRSPLIHLKNLSVLRRFVVQNNIDVINSFKSNGAFVFSIIRGLHPDICYIKTRGTAQPPKNHFLNRFIHGPAVCDGIITVGRQVRNWIGTLLRGEEVQSTAVIYYGDNPPVSERSEAKEKIKSRLGLSGDKKVIALLGRTQRVKGHMILLEAFASMPEKYLQLLFLVKDLDEYPEQLEEIRTFIHRHNLDERVAIQGFQSNLDEVFTVIDCGVIPSLASEVNCRVCVEFFSAGIPVIAFPTGSLPDIIDHGKNGYLCEHKTGDSLRKGLEWFMQLGDSYLDIRENAIKEYQEHYTLEKLAMKTLEFYENCIEKKRRHE